MQSLENSVEGYQGHLKVDRNSFQHLCLMGLSPMYRISLNFAKSCVLSCLSNVDNVKIFHRAVF